MLTIKLRRWCENNADICTWSEERQECWRGAAMITAGMTTASATTTGFTSGPETDSLPVYVGISVGIIVFIIIVIVIAIVVTQRCSGQSKAASVRRAVTHSQVRGCFQWFAICLLGLCWCQNAECGPRPCPGEASSKTGNRRSCYANSN